MRFKKLSALLVPFCRRERIPDPKAVSHACIVPASAANFRNARFQFSQLTFSPSRATHSQKAAEREIKRIVFRHPPHHMNKSFVSLCVRALKGHPFSAPRWWKFCCAWGLETLWCGLRCSQRVWSTSSVWHTLLRKVASVAERKRILLLAGCQSLARAQLWSQNKINV